MGPLVPRQVAVLVEDLVPATASMTVIVGVDQVVLSKQAGQRAIDNRVFQQQVDLRDLGSDVVAEDVQVRSRTVDRSTDAV